MSTPAAITTPDTVAVILRARTQSTEGRELGLWTEDTRPTVLQVEATIDFAHQVVAMQVGWECPEPCLEAYGIAVALEAACLIEKSYFPEQIESRRSAYEELRAESDSMRGNLLRCISDGGLGPGEAEGGAGGGVYSICTPLAYQPKVFRPANWNDPAAFNIDVPEEGSPASQWLEGMQSTWAGEVQLDSEGNVIAAPAPAASVQGTGAGADTVDTRQLRVTNLGSQASPAPDAEPPPGGWGS